jgi:hypothetical protein
MVATYQWDLFISHATEDKEAIAQPLAMRLQDEGVSVWYDDFSLILGDSLRESLDYGLLHSRLGIVILSHHFFSKKWPRNELDGLLAKERAGQPAILPVWHGIDSTGINQYSPMLAGRVGVPSTDLDVVVHRVVVALNRAKVAELRAEPLSSPMALPQTNAILTTKVLSGALTIGLLDVSDRNQILLSDSFQAALIRSARETVTGFRGRFREQDWPEFVVRAALDVAGDSTDADSFGKVVANLVGLVGAWMITQLGVELKLIEGDNARGFRTAKGVFEAWLETIHIVMDSTRYRSKLKARQEIMRICRQVVRAHLALEWPASASIDQLTDIAALVLYLDLDLHRIVQATADFAVG